MKVLVLMSGGFHPFHPGHLALYNSAKKSFPGADVVIGATNVQKQRPFNFKDKETLATIAGVDKGHFVEVNRQFSVKGEPNIENRIQNPDDTILIFVRSEKDANDPALQPWKLNPDGSIPMTKGSKNHPPRPTSNYLLPYSGNEKKLQPMTKHAYIAFLPVKEFSGDMTSASEIRNEWPNLDKTGKITRAMSLYPATQNNKKLLSTVVNILDKNIGSTAEPVAKPTKSAVSKLKNKKLGEELLTLINVARPLLKEASPEQKLKFLKLVKENLQEISFFKLKKDDKEEQPEEKDEEDDDQLGYEHLFKQKEEPKPLPKVYHGWDEYEKEKSKDDEVDEAKIHFTDPSTRVNLYYIPPKLQAIGKVQNIAHNIPYSTVVPLIQKIKEKYPQMDTQYMVWFPIGADKYGQRLSENVDYLEEK